MSNMTIQEHHAAVKVLEDQGFTQIELYHEMEALDIHGSIITDVVVGPDGQSVFIKTREKDDYREAREFIEECEKEDV